MEYWKNNKTGQQELIADMTPRQLAYKLRLVTSRVNSHQAKLESLKKIRRSLLDTLVTKGKRAEREEEVNGNVICMDDKERPIVVNNATLKANNVKLSDLISEGRITLIPDTSLEDDL